jgi:hypothetical protein
MIQRLRMPDDRSKITVTWQDLNSRRVETRVREQEALTRTRRYAQMKAESVPESALAVRPSGRLSQLCYQSAVYMTVFGLLGGLLAWGAGAALGRLRPEGREQAAGLLASMDKLRRAEQAGRIKKDEALAAADEIRWIGRRNPHFLLAANPDATLAERRALETQVRRNDLRVFIANVLAYGLCGVLIAVCLAAAEPAVERNWPAAAVNASVGAVLGLVGGVVVALIVEPLYRLIAGGGSPDVSFARHLLARAITWGVLGLFLTIGPAVVMRNVKKLGIGLLGGLLGGLIGGALYQVVVLFTDGPEMGETLGRLIALVAIGVVAGAGTGLIENAAKTGWLKVTAGLIAGKQFILYRNPTFIGAAADCPIFLYRDPAVGRRHAAIHLVPGGFELQDLPLGGPTVVNGRPTTRTRLRHGDSITVGRTSFLFQEKLKPAKK